MSDQVLTALAAGFVLPAETSIVGPVPPLGPTPVGCAAAPPACAPTHSFELPEDGPGIARPGHGLPNPAETRKDAHEAERVTRPACSRCLRAPVADRLSVLCDACGDHMIDLARDAEAEGEDWWGR